MDQVLLDHYKEGLLPANVGDISINFGKFSRGAVVAAFELMGGVEEFAQWAEDNPHDFYTKLFPRLIGREEAKVQRPDNVEDLLTILDGEAEDITDKAPESSEADSVPDSLLQIGETKPDFSDSVTARLAEEAAHYASGEPVD